MGYRISHPRKNQEKKHPGYFPKIPIPELRAPHFRSPPAAAKSGPVHLQVKIRRVVIANAKTFCTVVLRLASAPF